MGTFTLGPEESDSEVRGTKGPKGALHAFFQPGFFRDLSKGKNPGWAQNFMIKISMTVLLITKTKIAQISNNYVIPSPSK